MRFLLSFLLFLITLFFDNHLVLVCGQCDSHQQSLLLQLKKHLIFNSSSSTKLVKWNQGGDSWDGVTCAEGRVIGLDLSYEFISAGVEDSSPLFSFHYLKTLNLAFNQFNGARISSRFGNLTNLSHLNLSNAGFAGQIPIGISHLISLVTIDLSDLYVPWLKLEDPDLPMLVQNLKKLEELHLDNVIISAQGNEWGQALSSALLNLRVLSLSRCNLSGPVHTSLVQLKYLSVVRLDGNNLSCPVPKFFANFSNLTYLGLSYCEFYGIFPPQIFKVLTLRTLDLSKNPMLHGFLPEFSQNGSLQTLVLRDTSFSGPLPESIGKLKMLTNIELSDCNFSGPIPNSMSKLTRLVNLDFSNNSFIGPIPSFSASRNLTQLKLPHNLLNGSIDSTDWESLLNLMDMDLRNNSFRGKIPMSLFKITSLRRLKLSHNQFTGFLNVSSPVFSYSLDILYLSNNMLQGEFPSFVFALKSLMFLDLSSNNFSGIVQLDMIQQLRNLSILDLSYNSLLINANGTDDTTLSFLRISTLKLVSCKLKTFPAFLESQSELIELDLSDNQIHGEIPKWIWKLPILSSLNLSHNFLVNAEGSLQNITTPLFVLDLHSNMLQGSIPMLSQNVGYLDYSDNNFSFTIPTDIGDYLAWASFVSLSNNSIHGSIPHSICSAQSLRVLDLSNNNLSGVIPQCLTMITSLGVLNLRKNNLSGNISDTFSNCALQTLDVNGNMLEGKLPKSLANCEGLEVLDLGNNNIHDTFPCYLMNMSSLRILVLRSNKFSGSIKCSGYNVSWPLLQLIDFASNNFSGELPRECLGSLKMMMVGGDKEEEKLKKIQFEVITDTQLYYDNVVTVTSFTSIDLSCNNFHGSISVVMGELTSLFALNLSHNALTGQIPSSLGNMQQLESLDLSRNKLNGAIPTQFANLNFLSVLDLSFNQLVGRIPTGTQLQTFSQAAFQGNAGLYGCPLTENCTNTWETKLPPQASEDSKNEINWELVCTEIGFTFGFGIVILPLMYWKRWRQRYYKHVDRILFRIFPRLDASRNSERNVQTRFWSRDPRDRGRL